MPVAKLTCPDCSAVLKPAKPVPEGKKIKCPKCGTIFEARAEEDEAPAPKPAAKKPASPVAAKKPAAPAKPKPAAPAPAKKSAAYSDDDDDDGGTYGVIKEPEDEKKDLDDEDDDDEDKPDLEFLPDLSVRDPRGPAQKAVIPPSNAIIGTGALTSIAGILAIGWAIWPMIFADHILEPKDVLTDPFKKGEPLQKEWKDLTAAQEQEMNTAEEEAAFLHWTVLGGAIFAFLYGGFVAYGGVKMQMLESYPWAMTASIMAFLPVPTGLWGLTVLKRPEVKAGFYAKVD